MNPAEGSVGENRCRRWLALAAVVIGVTGCASGRSYVVLVPDEDGTNGRVSVSGAKGTTWLDKPNEGTVIGAPAGEKFVVAKESLAKEFGPALAATPMKPVTFLFYFETGRVTLTRESEASVPSVLDAIRKRPAPDISVVGHTDTVGKNEDNVALGWGRARFVARLFESNRIGTDRISIESHGEKNLLVPTPDNTDEPRNRRVEIMVR